MFFVLKKYSSFRILLNQTFFLLFSLKTMTSQSAESPINFLTPSSVLSPFESHSITDSLSNVNESENHQVNLSLEDKRALELAFELSKLEIPTLESANLLQNDLTNFVSDYSLNAFKSMLAANGNSRSKKSQNITECVPVPTSEHVAEIVGKQGSKIKALRAKTNTYIKTPVRGDEPVFIITGRKEDVAKVKCEILSAAEHFSAIRAREPSRMSSKNRARNIPGHITIHIPVPYSVVGLVVGPKGSTIKNIQQSTNTYILSPARDKESVFEVTGLPDNVEQARQQIEAHIAMRTGNYPNTTISSDSIADILGNDVMSPSPEFLSSLYKSSLVLDFMQPAQTNFQPKANNPFEEAAPMFLSNGSSACSSTTSSESASLKSLRSEFSFDLEEHDPLNIWAIPNPASICGSRSSPFETTCSTDSAAIGTTSQSLKVKLCSVCGGKDITIALVNCGHIFCSACSSRIKGQEKSTVCPVCIPSETEETDAAEEST